MTRTLRVSALCAMLVLLTVSTFTPVLAQDRPLVGTVIDVDEGRGRLQIESDDEAGSRLTIETDSVSTTYYGFGSVIAGKPEIFTGSSGLANIRLGDRVNVRANSRGQGVWKADRVTLVGRAVAATSVGVGQTRDPGTSVSTPTDDRATGTAISAGTAEGTVRQINLDEGRIVIQTNQRRMMTIRTARNTPVIYRGETYRTSNLEIGDLIRVEADPRDAEADEITARRIEVTRSIQENDTAPGSGGLVTMLNGRVTRVETGPNYVYIDGGRNEVRVDMGQAEDARGDAIRAADIRVGDRLEMSGSYNRAGDLFLASTVRFGVATAEDLPEEALSYGLVTITGTVTETLEEAPTVSIRDRDSNRVLRLWVASGLVARTRGNTYTTAEQLRLNDTVVVEAFRDTAGNLIAQTVRLRNR